MTNNFYQTLTLHHMSDVVYNFIFTKILVHIITYKKCMYVSIIIIHSFDRLLFTIMGGLLNFVSCYTNTSNASRANVILFRIQACNGFIHIPVNQMGNCAFQPYLIEVVRNIIGKIFPSRGMHNIPNVPA